MTTNNLSLSKNVCKFPKCQKPTNDHSLCDMHKKRFGVKTRVKRIKAPKKHAKRHQTPEVLFKIETEFQEHREIPLGQGKVCLVDAADYEVLKRYNWCYTNAGAMARIKVKQWLMHRYIMQPPEGFVVDHINHNHIDNRSSNLRITTSQQNSQNSRKNKHKSFFKGVYYSPSTAKLYKHKIKPKIFFTIFNSQRIGRFDTAVAAAIAYDKEAKTHYGEYACLNFPDFKNIERLAETVDRLETLTTKLKTQIQQKSIEGDLCQELLEETKTLEHSLLVLLSSD